MQFKYILLTIVAAIGWGFSGTCSEHLFKTYGTNGEWLTSIRLLTAGLLLILISLASGQGRALLAFCATSATAGRCSFLLSSA